MMTKLLTEAETKKYYEQGRRAAQTYSDLHTAVFEKFSGPELWPFFKAFEIGFKGRPFVVETFQRIGDLPEGYDGWVAPSSNYADDTQESGVSVMDDEWLRTVSAMFFLAQSKKVITVRGIRCGTGSDGEPIILPVKD